MTNYNAKEIGEYEFEKKSFWKYLIEGNTWSVYEGINKKKNKSWKIFRCWDCARLYSDILKKQGKEKSK